MILYVYTVFFVLLIHAKSISQKEKKKKHRRNKEELLESMIEREVMENSELNQIAENVAKLL